MSAGPRIPATDAYLVAETLAELLRLRSPRVLIGGSLRRGKPTVADIEIIALCAFEKRDAPGQRSLFDPPSTIDANLTCEHIDALVLASEPGPAADWAPPGQPGCHLSLQRGEKWGDRYRQLRVDWYERPTSGLGWPLVLDCFLVHDPGQWGWLSLLRTGSGDFNRVFLEHLRMAGVTADGGWLWKDGHRLVTPEETDVFEAARRPFVEPKNREVLGPGARP